MARSSRFIILMRHVFNGTTFYLQGFNKRTGEYIITLDKELARKYNDVDSYVARKNLGKLVNQVGFCINREIV